MLLTYRSGLLLYSTGAFQEDRDEPLWDGNVGQDSLEQLLREAEGHVRVLSGWSATGDDDYARSPQDNEHEVLVSSGCCFIVQTYMLSILQAATDGRVSPQRLWRLAMAKGHFFAHDFYVLPEVDYGPIRKHLCQYPWYLGNVQFSELRTMGCIGTPEEVAEALRRRGYWMWMRPDRSVRFQ